jgi:hypothetical protein
MDIIKTEKIKTLEHIRKTPHIKSAKTVYI